LLRYVLHTGGILLLSDCCAPLALSLLRPVIVNYPAFPRIDAPDGLPMAVIVAALWTVPFSRVKVRVCRLFSAEV
jgi:hypothetical protein